VIAVPAAIPIRKHIGQFDVNDSRTSSEVVAAITECGLDPVWKDWDNVLW